MNRKPHRPKRVRNHVNPLADRSQTVFKGFSNNKPLILDIGAYRGEFSEQLIERFGATHNFIVTEIRKPYAQYLRELFLPHDNVVVFDGDSSRNITNLLESSVKKGSEVDYIFINFPDPWFKDRHKKRRVLNEDFLSQLETLIDENTKLIFQTDQKQLFEETMELVQMNPRWTYEYFNEPLWGIRSHWEEMKVSEGKSVYRAKICLTIESE